MKYRILGSLLFLVALGIAFVLSTNGSSTTTTAPTTTSTPTPAPKDDGFQLK